MLRLVYNWILRCHPPGFRRCFAEEMLGIFDQAVAVEKAAGARLLIDGLVSLMRQWILRPEFREEPAIPDTGSEGVPGFCSLESFRPRPGALIHGAVFSLAMFSAALLAMRYSTSHRAHFVMPVVESASSAPEREVAIVPSVVNSESVNSVERRAASAPAMSAAAESQTRPELKPAPEMQSQRQVPPPAPGNRSTRPNAQIAGAVRTAPPLERLRAGSSIKDAKNGASGTRGSAIATGQAAVAVHVPQQVLASYVGTYAADPPGRAVVSVILQNGVLEIEIEGQARKPLVEESQTRFSITGSADGWVEFLRNQDGTVRELNIYQSGRRITTHRR